MKNSKISISDIAKELNISTISVSRALAGQCGVSEDLRSKILSKAKEMGYSKFKSNKDLNILVLHQKPYVQDNSNFSSMVQGIEKSLQKNDISYNVEFIDKENQDKLFLPSKLSKGYTFDGAIFIGKFDKKYIEFITPKIKSPVFYTGYSPSYDYDSVIFNFNNGGYKQCQHLISKGHKRIAFIGNTGFFRNKERLLGITSALEDYKIEIDNNLFINSNVDLNESILTWVKDEKPTAIICQWDYTAIKLIKLLHENGISVPNDISIIGSGNTEMGTLCFPSLTTLDLNIEYSCEVTVNLLLKKISNPNKPNESISINSRLIERESVIELLK